MEIYKEIDDKYAVSNFGNVVNMKTGRILKPTISNEYYKVDLYNNGVKKPHKVHRLVGLTFIQNPENKPCLDHFDRNKLNNNENNLRWCSFQENQRNRIKQQSTSSIYKGVSYQKRDDVWQANIKINYKRIHLGSYKTEDEGGLAYNNYILEHKLEEYFILNEI
jgi:hypothetical protein